ncbi:hypothetical protein Patl1_31153 [Pistacia atlantica]|uniref:Uncharacterized protein n=1 Tax=Pistacia atlantica TaxID=434234 RepID=A0ACC1AAH0_9ROSI|nr:hypothetical protein Patl1_31153 [Pistacia atlantica]
MRELEEKSKRVRVAKEMREKIGDKERHISGFKKTVNVLESFLDKWKVEKKSVEGSLKESESKSKEIEAKISELEKEIDEAKTVISGLKEKTLDRFNGNVRDFKPSVDDGWKKSNLQWLVVAATAYVVAVAVIDLIGLVTRYHCRDSRVTAVPCQAVRRTAPCRAAMRRAGAVEAVELLWKRMVAAFFFLFSDKFCYFGLD